VRLNAIVIDPRSPNCFAIGGSDEYARVYDIHNYHWDASSNEDRPIDSFSPHHLIGNDRVNITGLAYSNQSELLASYNDELIYLFQRKWVWVSGPIYIFYIPLLFIYIYIYTQVSTTMLLLQVTRCLSVALVAGV
jgi:hypothetical protein